MPKFDTAICAIIQPERAAYMGEQAKVRMMEKEKLAQETKRKKEMMAGVKKQKDADCWKARAAQHQRETMATAKNPKYDKHKEVEVNAWLLAKNKKESN